MDVQDVTLIINTVSMLLVGISAFLLRKQIQAEHEWNRRKVAEETLTRFTSGDFTDSLDELDDQFQWNILLSGGDLYENIIERLSEKEKKDIDRVLVNIFRNLETVCIKMRHGVLDEDISYDYLFSVLTIIDKKCKVFVENVREARNEPRVYENTEHYALKWASKK